MYRINVGGKEISPGDDSEMLRHWLKDNDYATIMKPSALPVNTTTELTFSSKIPSFSAPKEVYVTARTMGTNKTENENYTLTWEFPVDSGFNYFVRLIAWSGGHVIPVYRDYVVAIGPKGNKKQQNLSIGLHPSPAWRTLYSDAILSGLEIFKRKFPADFNQFQEEQQSSIRHRGRLESVFLYSEIIQVNQVATHNFDDVSIIGVGGFGNVYKGFIDCGATQVAIKRLKPGSQQGSHEFRTEIEMLSQLRHVHLVSLIGYCNDGSEMILVYDYMANGTLRDHLYNTENPPLPWKQRLEICLGATIGLQYLHSGAKHTIIHQDFKTTNILLDEKWVAKVSDFGLSSVGPTNMSQTHVSTVVKGSFGYLDPEYSRRVQLTEKSDVYSFGVVDENG
ncbi:receptor-like protein kinase FERONIA-like [Hibiscus syriacus]|uniref:Receptor-like protein kinase FERONIA-like n=1 Tax=Hibiscus syriacus TaxID=106335 RepID=A0A6A2Z3V4_HIBSY|nr:receptor-like protein kinase FERONIA-like [Hibiscus syriacus]